jgi:hypothetical protein
MIIQTFVKLFSVLKKNSYFILLNGACLRWSESGANINIKGFAYSSLRTIDLQTAAVDFQVRKYWNNILNQMRIRKETVKCHKADEHEWRKTGKIFKEMKIYHKILEYYPKTDQYYLENARALS